MVQRLGRKLSLMFSAVPFVGGFTVMVAAQNVWMLYLGRVLTGVASGVASLVVPLYISETSHEGLRGLLGSCVQLMVVIGIMGVYLAGLVLDWRWLAVCSSVPPTLMLLVMCFLPETPRFLLSRGRRREAEEALRFLRGPNARVEWERTRIEEATHNQSDAGGDWLWSELRDPALYKPLLLGVFLMVFQQMTGINAIMFYAESIFQQAHFQNGDLGSVLIGVVQVVFTLVAALVMDRAGRKLLLVLSGASMALSTAAFGVYFYLLDQPQPQTQLSSLALVSMGVFITGFALGWGPIPWLLMSEILPVKVRGFAGALCVLTNWSMAFIVTKTFHDMMDVLTSAGTFWLFSFMCVLNLVFTAVFVPETKGKSLEQIEAIFRRPPSQ